MLRLTLSLAAMIFIFHTVAFAQDDADNNENPITNTGKSTNFSALLSINCFNASSYCPTIQAEYNFGLLYNGYITAKIGFGFMPYQQVPLLTAPIEVNYSLFSKSRHHLELGLGASYFNGLNNYKSWDEKSTFSFDNVYLAPSIGYRWDSFGKGLYFTANYYPMLLIYDGFDQETYANKAISDWMLISPYTSKLEQLQHWENQPQRAQNLWINFGLSVGYRF